MSVIRAFIAVDLSPEILAQIDRISAELQQRIGGQAVRWVQVKNIHLTLKFLGDVSEANLDLLKTTLAAEVANHSKLTVSVGGVGAFPKVKSPRVIWVGVEAPEGLNVLQRGIESQVERLGYAREERQFSPHLTLGRVARTARPDDIRKISSVLEGYPVGFLGISPVESVNLYQSDLRPGGAVYTRLINVPLGETTNV